MGGIKRKLLLSLLGCGAAFAIATPAANAGLSWGEASYDFGSHNVGSAAPDRTFTLMATCDLALPVPPFPCVTPTLGIHNFGVPVVTGEGFALAAPNDCNGGTLSTPDVFDPTDFCSTTVTFSPATAGAKAGSLTLPSGPDISLSGTGVANETTVMTPPTTSPPKKCKKGFKKKKKVKGKVKCVKKKKKKK